MHVNEVKRTDVVVVGAGNAAICAALAAREAGAQVVVLERAPEAEAGGNSFFTAGATRFVFNSVAELREIIDVSEVEERTVDFGIYSAENYFDDMGRVTQYRADPDLLELLVTRSRPTLAWMRRHGVRFEPMYGRQAVKFEGRFKFFGGQVAAFWGGGAGLVKSLHDIAKKAGVAICYETPAVALIRERGRVLGVVVQAGNEQSEIRAGATVLACGGFESNTEMRARYLGANWDLAKVRGTRFNTGMGLEMALAAGARPCGHWSGVHAVGWDLNSPPYGDRAVGDGFQKHSYPLGIMVNADGERFVDEGADFRNYTYAKYGHEVLKQPQMFAWQVFDGKIVPLLRDEYRIKQVTKVEANTLEALAAKLEGVNAQRFLATVAEFNGAVCRDIPFNPNVRDGRCTTGLRVPKSNWANPLDTPPFQAYAVTCGVTFTFGGISISTRGAVQSVAGADIPGLYAAGEMVGGLFYFNYPSGTGLVSGAVFGRIAGSEAGAVRNAQRHRMTPDCFNALRALALPSGEPARYLSLPALEQAGLGRISRLPVTLRIMLESLARNCDGRRVTREHVEALASWQPNGRRTAEVPFVVGRVVAHEVAGIPALGDLAAMRNAARRLGRDPAAIEPRVPVTMVIDHTLQVDHHTEPDALARNVRLEMQRNEERFRFVKWAQQAFKTFDVIPPGHGILHQVNLEYLARGLLRQGDLLYPDTLVGTDSHTVMIAGIGVVGWGVGGMEASAAMLGEPICILSPDVIGVHLTGRLPAGVTATDLVLSITERLRVEDVVSKFVEYFGVGVRSLTVPDRATLSNMTPEYGATIGYFPPDAILCDYFTATGRTPMEIDAFRAYFTAQGMFGIPGPSSIDYTRVIEFDLAQVRPSMAGPKRPQDRCDLGRVREQFGDWLRKPVAQGGYGKTPQAVGIGPHAIRHGHVLLAAISSCTNTANPSVMLAAGLLARNAVARGLRTQPWVKTSLTPGSRAVAIYLEKTGLQQPLDALGFRLVGFGCATCNGGSGPLDPLIEAAVVQGDVIGCAVLSGNRNFEARIHATCKATYLMSPPLVVACALAGTLDIDFERDPLGTGSDGANVYLRDIWPETAELQRLLPQAFNSAAYREAYARFDHNSEWNAVPAPDGPLFPWDEASTYIKEPPFFLDFSLTPSPVSDIVGARALAILGDTITTDHISPVNLIPLQTPAGSYLRDMGVKPADFNLYGARRMNHEVLVRTTFANLRLRNLMVPGIEGGHTRHQPDSAQMAIFDAAMRYRADGVPQFVFAGADYGMGSARDSAAKGTALLGVKAVFATSFERIHRTNLVCVGVLPCQFVYDRGLEFLNLAGDESFDLKGIDDNIAPQQQAVLRVCRANGEAIEVQVILRLDTPAEVECFRQGGLLPGYLRTLMNAP